MDRHRDGRSALQAWGTPHVAFRPSGVALHPCFGTRTPAGAAPDIGSDPRTRDGTDLGGSMKRVLLSLAALAAVSMAAAQPFVWPNAWTAAEPGEAAYGGTFRDSAISDPRTFNPIVSAEQNQVVDLADATTLIQQGPDSDAFIPYMAESFEISDDGLVVTIDVREGMKWSDGEDITAQDFYLTYLAETDPDVGSNGFDSWFIGDAQIEAELVDDMTLRFVFPTQDRTALPVLAIVPTPDHILGEIYREGGAEALKGAWGTDAEISETVWATAFVPTEYVPGQRVVFERNDYFGEWNVDEQGNALPYLDRYVVQTVESTDAALNLYLAGEIDAYSPANLDEVGVVNQAINNGDIDATLLPNVAPVASSQFIVFNWNKAGDPFKQDLFRNTAFRQAMSHLVDREALVDLVYGGSASPMWSNVYQVYDFWVNPDVPAIDFNLLVGQLLSTGEDRPFDAILIGLQGGNRVWPFGVNVIPCGTNLHMWNTSGECLTAQETLAEELYFQGRQELDTDAAREVGYRLQTTLATLQSQIFTVSPLSHYSWLNEVAGEHPAGLINDALGSRELPLTFKAQ